MTTTDKVASATTASTHLTATAHLHALGEALQGRGLYVRVGATDGGLPQLIVVSTGVPTLSEVIFAAQRQGTWWFWWSWAERIAPVDDLSTTEARIRQALTPADRQNR
ncbi:hypothetical protein AB0B89_34480 [Sphaerisporangium sp. NPDC049002]|uniref:hypothetical protein n=1 Tax=unclassified Sphaerisporangium TaxID=2630420 RepID=UPI0034028ABB